MERTLVALHAHPDDESSKGAGAVAGYHDDGVRCVLITATGGEAGDVLNPALDRPEVAERLAEIRSRELAAAAAIIGYDDVVLLGYRDSGMPGSADNSHEAAFVNADFDAVLEQVVQVVRSERPDVFLGYDAHERYPHPDHIRVHQISLAVWHAAADPQRFPDAGPPWAIPKMYAPAWTVRRMQALHHAMEESGRESPYARWMEGLDRDEEDERRLTAVDVGRSIERARAALRAHETQVDPNGFWFKVPAAVVRAAYPYEDFELLATRVGWDEHETDLFAGIDRPTDRAPG
jgi:mycothiol S-conjugate amidase